MAGSADLRGGVTLRCNILKIDVTSGVTFKKHKKNVTAGVTFTKRMLHRMLPRMLRLKAALLQGFYIDVTFITFILIDTINNEDNEGNKHRVRRERVTSSHARVRNVAPLPQGG